jgi:hypothetical protein
MKTSPSFRACTAGVALIEFALVLPLLILLFVGATEVTRFAILHQKLDKAASAMADYVTQGKEVASPDLDVFSQALQQIVNPFSFNGTVIFTSVLLNADVANPPCPASPAPCIMWQGKRLGSDASLIGAAGGAASLPAGFTMQNGQNIIVTEIFYHFDPILPLTGTLIPALGSQTVYKSAIYKPRINALPTLH